MNDLDKLTLDLMVTRKKSAVQPPSTSDIMGEHKREIKQIIYKLLSDPDTEISHEVNESFDQLIRACVRHIDLKSRKWQRDQDELFPTNSMSDIPAVPYINPHNKQHFSLWGTAVHKILPKIRETSANRPTEVLDDFMYSDEEEQEV
jgi:hypothetical protein